jgi:hypothetical protein
MEDENFRVEVAEAQAALVDQAIESKGS